MRKGNGLETNHRYLQHSKNQIDIEKGIESEGPGHAGYPVFQKGQQLWSNHDVKLCAMIQRYLHRKNGLVSSSPWRKEKWAGFIQPTEKRKMGWLHPAHGAKDHREKETWTGFEKRRKGSRSKGDIRTGNKLREFTGKCVYLSQSMV